MTKIFSIKKYYKWTLPEDVTIVIPKKYALPDFENEWVTIKNNVMTIHQGYSWDGCSPKRIIFDKIILGTWDGPVRSGRQICYYPSLFHDVLCQFKIGDRETADKIFKWSLKVEGFIFRGPYYSAVRVFGTFFDRF